MIYGEILGVAAYKVIDMAQLPPSVSDAIDCPGNDVANIINPKYNPTLKQWLQDNGHDTETCYIAWWSW